VQYDLHNYHHHLPRLFPPLAVHEGEEETTIKTPAMAGHQEFESLSNTYAQRSLIIILGEKRRAKILPHGVPYKKPRSSYQGAEKKESGRS
jgi:hypothetical protein